jgi:L-2,4-diaminobutyrate decarboxylase
VGSVLAADDDFELAAVPQLSTLVFRYRPRVTGEALAGDRGGLADAGRAGTGAGPAGAGLAHADPADAGAWLTEDAADTLNPAIRAAVFASGQAIVAGTTVAGRHYLKFTLLNAEATLEDISEIIDLLRRTGAQLLANAGTTGVSA